MPILTYHSLDHSGSVISTPPSVFRDQMQALRRRGYQGIALGELLDAWDTGTRPWRRPVVVTFDDGFANFVTEALPVLAALDFRATVFVVAGHCGGKSAWAGAERHASQALLSMGELRRLRRQGVEIGSHGLGHVALDGLNDVETEREVAESRRTLQQLLGRPVTVFAYPFGRADGAARARVRQHYRAACSTELGCARESDDRQWLSRIDMYYFRQPAAFRFFGTPLGHAYLGTRALARRARRAWQARTGAGAGR